MAKKRCSPGLDDRCRDQSGRIRQKNGSTEIGTLRDTYGPGFAAGMRSDAHLKTLLQATRSKSLSDFLKKGSK